MICKAITSFLFIAALTTLALGVVSYARGVPEDSLWINGHEERPRIRLAMIEGTLHVVHTTPTSSGKADAKLELGPFYAKRVTFGRTLASGVGAPFWFVFGGLMFCPTIAFARGPLRRRRRRKRGECVHCGYSLTGLTQPRCPECGRAFTPHAPRVGTQTTSSVN